MSGDRASANRVGLNPDGIPPALRAMPHWVAWQLVEPKKPGKKWGKQPIDPHTGGAGSSTNAKTWGTLPEALARMKQARLDGVGFVLTRSGFTGVDLDHCRDPVTGEVESWAQDILAQLSTYTEVSPSGTGVHALAHAALPGPGRKRGDIEIYDTGRYFTVTGIAIPDMPPHLVDRQEAIDALYAELGKRQGSTKRSHGPTHISALDDDDLVRHASEAGNGPKFRTLWSGSIEGYSSQSEADLALCAILAYWTRDDAPRIDRLFRLSGLFRSKWDESHGETTYGQRTIQKALSSAGAHYREGLANRVRSTRNDPLPLTDTGNSERLVARFGQDLRYCFPWKKWLAFDGKCWQRDQRGVVMAHSKSVARAINAEAARCEDDAKRGEILKWAKASEKAERRKATVDLSQSETGIPIHPGQLDRHPYLLNCPNGTLDLEYFELRPHRREDFLTKLCPTRYVPNAPCPIWRGFLERVLPEDEVRDYLQRFFGYSLTGDVCEQMILLALGPGANGKSTMLRGMQDTLSPCYAIQIPSDLLIAKQHESHPTQIADLFGVRLAVGIETSKGKALDEALLKQLTGCDRIRARRMREDFWEFEPTHKLVLVTNHMPQISFDDYAVVRRLHVLPFHVRILEGEKDKRLPRKLHAEREGILAWAVEGCRQWRERGLDPPEQVLALPRSAMRPKRPVEEFVEHFVRRKPGEHVGAGVLYEAFVAWCGRNDHRPASQQEFGTYLGNQGFGRKKSDGTIRYLDIELHTPFEARREDQGGEGPLSPLFASVQPREGSNEESGPSRPYSSLNGNAHAREPSDARVLSPAPERACSACRGTRFWRLRASSLWVCCGCSPPSDDLADAVWSDEVRAGGCDA